jgi:hypothetical protein
MCAYTYTYTYTYTTERYRTINVTCHRTAVIMWHCGADICVPSVHSNRPPKTVHNQVAVPLTTYRPSKHHIRVCYGWLLRAVDYEVFCVSMLREIKRVLGGKCLGRPQLRVPITAYVARVFVRPNSSDMSVSVCLSPMALAQAVLVPEHQK